MYTVRSAPIFEKKFNKIIPKNKQDDIKSRINKLAVNPYVGKPLRYNNVRELKLEKFRIYFVIYKNDIVVLLVDISDKKTQQKVIEHIIEKYIKNINKEEIL